MVLMPDGDDDVDDDDEGDNEGEDYSVLCMQCDFGNGCSFYFRGATSLTRYRWPFGAGIGEVGQRKVRTVGGYEAPSFVIRHLSACSAVPAMYLLEGSTYWPKSSRDEDTRLKHQPTVPPDDPRSPASCPTLTPYIHPYVTTLYVAFAMRSRGVTRFPLEIPGDAQDRFDW